MWVKRPTDTIDMPNYVLLLGAPCTGKIKLVKHIFSDKIELDSIDKKSHSGLIFKGTLANKYYSYFLNLFVDEYIERDKDVSRDGQEDIKLECLHKWYKEFSSDALREVRDVLNGLIFCVNIDEDSSEYFEECLKIVSSIRDLLAADRLDWDGFTVIMGKSITGNSDDVFVDTSLGYGIEFLNLSQAGENEYRDRVGIDRLMEIMETHEWQDVQVKNYDSERRYISSKTQKAEDMCEGLLSDTEQSDKYDTEIDLNGLLEKVNYAKDNVQHVNKNQRHEYISKVIEETLDYI